MLTNNVRKVAEGLWITDFEFKLGSFPDTSSESLEVGVEVASEGFSFHTHIRIFVSILSGRIRFVSCGDNIYSDEAVAAMSKVNEKREEIHKALKTAIRQRLKNIF